MTSISSPKYPENVFYDDNHPPFWLSSDQLIVVISSFDKSTNPDTQGIWLYSVPLGKSERIVSAPICPNTKDSVSPNKKYLIFCADKSGLLEFATKQVKYLPSYVSEISWSPDGNFVAYQDSWSDDQRGLWITNLSTYTNTRIVSTVNMDATGMSMIQWSADSNTLTFDREVICGNCATRPPEQVALEGIWQINRDGTNLKKLGPLITQ